LWKVDLGHLAQYVIPAQAGIHEEESGGEKAGCVAQLTFILIWYDLRLWYPRNDASKFEE